MLGLRPRAVHTVFTEACLKFPHLHRHFEGLWFLVHLPQKHVQLSEIKIVRGTVWICQRVRRLDALRLASHPRWTARCRTRLCTTSATAHICCVKTTKCAKSHGLQGYTGRPSSCHAVRLIDKRGTDQRDKAKLNVIVEGLPCVVPEFGNFPLPEAWNNGASRILGNICWCSCTVKRLRNRYTTSANRYGLGDGMDVICDRQYGDFLKLAIFGQPRWLEVSMVGMYRWV